MGKRGTLGNWRPVLTLTTVYIEALGLAGAAKDNRMCVRLKPSGIDPARGRLAVVSLAGLQRPDDQFTGFDVDSVREGTRIRRR